jgi:hypothetical protein
MLSFKSIEPLRHEGKRIKITCPGNSFEDICKQWLWEILHGVSRLHDLGRNGKLKLISSYQNGMHQQANQIGVVQLMQKEILVKLAFIHLLKDFVLLIFTRNAIQNWVVATDRGVVVYAITPADYCYLRVVSKLIKFIFFTTTAKNAAACI